MRKIYTDCGVMEKYKRNVFTKQISFKILLPYLMLIISQIYCDLH